MPGAANQLCLCDDEQLGRLQDLFRDGLLVDANDDSREAPIGMYGGDEEFGHGKVWVLDAGP